MPQELGSRWDGGMPDFLEPPELGTESHDTVSGKIVNKLQRSSESMTLEDEGASGVNRKEKSCAVSLFSRHSHWCVSPLPFRLCILLLSKICRRKAANMKLF